MATPSAAWRARSQKRRDGELTLLRRPSEALSQHSVHSTAYSTAPSSEQAAPSPVSPHSSFGSRSGSYSGGSSSLVDDFDKLQALQVQLHNNRAQMETNEDRMRSIQDRDDEMGGEIQRRLDEVSRLNQRLHVLTSMLIRAEKVAKGDFQAT